MLGIQLASTRLVATINRERRELAAFEFEFIPSANEHGINCATLIIAAVLGGNITHL